MTEFDLFKETLPDVALYQNNKSTYLSYFSITSFNMTTVTPTHVSCFMFNFFIYHLEILVTIEIAFDWYKDIAFTISPVFSSPKLNLQQIKPSWEDRENWLMVIIAKVVQRHLSTEFIVELTLMFWWKSRIVAIFLLFLILLHVLI